MYFPKKKLRTPSNEIFENRMINEISARRIPSVYLTLTMKNILAAKASSSSTTTRLLLPMDHQQSSELLQQPILSVAWRSVKLPWSLWKLHLSSGIFSLSVFFSDGGSGKIEQKIRPSSSLFTIIINIIRLCLSISPQSSANFISRTLNFAHYRNIFEFFFFFVLPE